MTKEEIKLALSIIRPAIRALTGEQKIKMIGYSGVRIGNNGVNGDFLLSVGEKNYKCRIKVSQVDILEKVIK